MGRRAPSSRLCSAVEAPMVHQPHRPASFVTRIHLDYVSTLAPIGAIYKYYLLAFLGCY